MMQSYQEKTESEALINILLYLELQTPKVMLIMAALVASGQVAPMGKWIVRLLDSGNTPSTQKIMSKVIELTGKQK